MIEQKILRIDLTYLAETYGVDLYNAKIEYEDNGDIYLVLKGQP